MKDFESTRLVRLHRDVRFRQEGIGCLISWNGHWFEGNSELLSLLREIDRTGDRQDAGEECLSGRRIGEMINELMEIGLVVETWDQVPTQRPRELGLMTDRVPVQKSGEWGPPIKVGLEITGLCNLACSFCSASNFPQNNMPLVKFEEILRWCRERGVFEVSISGGEPFLHPEILSILSNLASTDSPRLLPMTTNGTWPFIRCLPALVDLGMRVVQISVPAVPRESFLSQCGRPVADIASSTRETLKQGIEVVFSTVVFPQWVDSLLWVAELAERLNVKTLHLMGVLPVGRGSSHARFSSREAVNFYRTILEIRNDYPGMRLDFNTEWLPSDPRKKGPKGHRSACPAGTDQLYVLPDGEVYPCNVMVGKSQFSCGNIDVIALNQIWEKAPAFQRLRTRESELKLAIPAMCSECTRESVCPGGCPAEMSRADTIHPQNCYGEDKASWPELEAVQRELDSSEVFKKWL